MWIKWLTTTFNYDTSVSYEDTIIKARPWDDVDLWYRLPEIIKKKINTKRYIFIWVVQDALKCNDLNERKRNIKEVFFELLLTLETWFTLEQVKVIVGNFDKFDSDLIVPIEKLKWNKNTFLLNESYWPTNTFKDIAFQMVTSIVEEQNRESIRKAVNEWIIWQKLKFVIIQTSTSWDTWSALWTWIEWKNFVMNVIGFNANEATFAQIWQMMRLKGNVLSIPMNESFSEIQEAMLKWNTKEYQRLLKKILDAEFENLINQYWFEIVVDSWSFNSINTWIIYWQTIYHEFALLQAEAKGIIKKDEEIIEVVPSWNWWHLFSVLMARLAKWYKWKTLITCDKNNLLFDMVKKWKFKKPEPWTAKNDPSVSMIIEYPNNMIRLFSYAFWPKKVKDITDRFFAWEEIILTNTELDNFRDNLGLVVQEVSWEEELETMKNEFIKTWKLLCPHTANALKWLEKYREWSDDSETKALVSETVSPWKFLAAIAAALNSENDWEKMKLYEEYKKLEKSKAWIDELLNIINIKYRDFWRIFDLSILPDNLREIYQNWFDKWESCAPSEFQEKTLRFLKNNVALMFRKQVERILIQGCIGNNIESVRNSSDI